MEKKLKRDLAVYIVGAVFIIIVLADWRFNIKTLLPTNFFHESTSLYFFSALLQSNAAIFSIVGIFIIFRIQSQQSILDSLKNMLMNDRGRIIHPGTVLDFDEKSSDEKEVYINTVSSNQLASYFKSWVKQEKRLLSIKNTIKYPTLIIAIGLILNIFGLVFSNYIHNNYNNLELIILTFFTLLQIYIIFVVVKTIFKVLLSN